MTKALYQFSNSGFREQLATHYIVPVARWLLGPEETGYLLPQIAGSNWECALALDFFARLSASGLREAQPVIQDGRAKLAATATWLLERAESEGGTASWDQNLWDTGVAAQAICLADRTDNGWGALRPDRPAIGRRLSAVGSWLCEAFYGYGDVVRYVDAPADLAQGLKAIMAIHDAALLDEVDVTVRDPLRVRLNRTAQEIVTALLAHEDIVARDVEDGQTETGFWVDALHTSEVVDSFASYLKFRRSIAHDAGTAARPEISAVQAAITRGMMHLEVTQRRGSWGVGELTCGTLFWYLATVSSLQELDHSTSVAVDHVVFRALRWMCDSDQALSDGSFLHTTYLTVFYALAVIEAYDTWQAGHKTAMEVYDLSLWDAITINTSERGRRFHLEWRVQELEEAAAEASESRRRRRAAHAAIASTILLAAALVSCLAVAGNLKLSVGAPAVSLRSANAALTWAVLSVAVPLVGAIVTLVYRRALRSKEFASQGR